VQATGTGQFGNTTYAAGHCIQGPQNRQPAAQPSHLAVVGDLWVGIETRHSGL
jgi:hypothetical protein